jgi:DNA-binding IclR family transcriptional regulator
MNALRQATLRAIDPGPIDHRAVAHRLGIPPRTAAVYLHELVMAGYATRNVAGAYLATEAGHRRIAHMDREREMP